jgi:hypothetical protein
MKRDFVPFHLKTLGLNLAEFDLPTSVISSFHRKVDENCALLGYYAASSGNVLPTFRDNLSVPSLGLKKARPLRMEPVGCSKTWASNYHYLLRNSPEKHGSDPPTNLTV